MRRRPTVSLFVMLLLGLLWCGAFSMLQGDTPWEPNDRGWFTAWVVQYVVIGALLVFLWSRRAHPLVIISTPIVIQVLAIVFARRGPAADSSDTSTFADGFLEIFQGMIIATAVTAAVLGISFMGTRPGRRPPS